MKTKELYQKKHKVLGKYKSGVGYMEISETLIIP